MAKNKSQWADTWTSTIVRTHGHVPGRMLGPTREEALSYMSWHVHFKGNLLTDLLPIAISLNNLVNLSESIPLYIASRK